MDDLNAEPCVVDARTLTFQFTTSGVVTYEDPGIMESSYRHPRSPGNNGVLGTGEWVRGCVGKSVWY